MSSTKMKQFHWDKFTPNNVNLIIIDFFFLFSKISIYFCFFLDSKYSLGKNSHWWTIL